MFGLLTTRGRLASLGLSLLSTACLMPMEAALADEIAFEWKRAVDIPDITATTPVALPLDDEFHENTREGWPDVLLLNRDQQPVAFVIRKATSSRQETRREYWPALQSAANLEVETGLSIVLDLKPDDPQPEGIRIHTPLRDFRQTVIVESSSDGSQWQQMGKPRMVFDYSRYVDARRDSIPFTTTVHRRFRIIVQSLSADQESELLKLDRRLVGGEEVARSERVEIDRRPFRVDRIEFYRDIQSIVPDEIATHSQPAQDLGVEEDEEKQETIVSFETANQPLTELTLETTSANFSRAVRIEVEREAPSGKKLWEQLGSGQLTHLDVAGSQQANLSIKIPETRAVRYRLIITNRDSPPLEVTSILTSGPVYELIFLASPGDSYELYFGSPSEKRGDYDTAALEAVLKSGTSREAATLGEAVRMGTPQPASRQFWNDPLILAGAVVVFTLVLGVLLYRASRQMSSSSGEET